MLFNKIFSNKQNSSTLITPQVNNDKHSGRVDINHLIARVRKEKSAENRITLVFFAISALLVVIVGILLSL